MGPTNQQKRTPRATVEEVPDQDDLPLRTSCTVTPGYTLEPVLDREDPPPLPVMDPNDDDEEPQEILLERTISDLEEDEKLFSYEEGGDLLTAYSHIEPPLTKEETSLHHGTTPSTPVNRYLKTRSGKLIPMAFSFGKVTTSTELAQAAHAKDKEKTLEEMIPPYLHDLLPAFDKGTASRLPMHTEYDHEIKLKPGFESMKAQVYPLAPAQRTELEKFIQENESKGYIRPSKSPVASPFFFVGKKDGSYRPCQDYRTLNANTIKDCYPLPLITDLMEKMKGARYFTKMDLRAGYNNVRVTT